MAIFLRIAANEPIHIRLFMGSPIHRPISRAGPGLIHIGHIDPRRGVMAGFVPDPDCLARRINIGSPGQARRPTMK
jgi:hypothetical protein